MPITNILSMASRPAAGVPEGKLSPFDHYIKTTDACLTGSVIHLTTGHLFEEHAIVFDLIVSIWISPSSSAFERSL